MTDSPPIASPSRGPLIGRIFRNRLGALSTVYLIVLVVVAIIGPSFVPYPPDKSSLDAVLVPPGGEHWLGGDSAGRDVFSRLLVATSFSLAGAALAVVIAGVIGTTSGLIAGYRGGAFDTLSGWLVGTIMALPGIVVLLAARSVIGPSLWWVMAIFGVILAPSYFRIVYSAVRAVREELYIDAARVVGLSDFRIIVRHIFAAVRAPVILLTAGLFATAIAVQAGLDFLGLGDPQVPTWGSILSDGFYNIGRTPLLMLWPTLAIGLTCVALTLLGNALRDSLEQTGDSSMDRGAGWQAPIVRPAAPIIHGSVPGPEPLLTIDRLAVGYRVGPEWKTVVDDVSLIVGRGEVHALIGESGSGKTQTAWSVLGLLPSGGHTVAGSIRLGETNLIGAPESTLQKIRGRRIGYVPQEPLSNLDPSFTVGYQLAEPMRFTLAISRPAAKARALELLDRVGIVDPLRVYSAYPHQISGGMAQRALIAMAVSSDPELIVADEPTTGLDVTVQAEILELLRTLQREIGLSILLVTHNFGVVADIADRVSVMRAGSIVETGPVAEVFANPKHVYTRALFAAVLDDVPARGPMGSSGDSA